MNRARRCLTPLLLTLMSAGALILCMTSGMEGAALGWTAALGYAATWLSRELDPEG